MAFLTSVKQNLIRTFENSIGFLWGSNLEHQGQSWLPQGFWGNGGGFINNKSIIGESDNKINPQLLVEVCRNQVIFAIKNTIRLRLKEKPYYFKGGKNTSKTLLKILKEADYERFIDVWLEAMLGTGGGNALCFVRDDKFVCEPFNTEGKTRVKVSGDYDRREIDKYEVVNSSLSKIAEFSADSVYHERYTEEGDFRFAINPAVVATRYYMIEKRAFGALETGFENIKKAKRFVSPDLSFIKDISEYDRPAVMKNWVDFTKVLSELPGFIASPTPMAIQNLTQTSAEMQTIDVLKYLDVVMGGAYSTSLSVLGRSDGVNYANGEQNADNFYQLAVETIKSRIEATTQRLMAELLPGYDEESNPFKFCKEYNEEDLKLRDQVLVTLKDIAPAVQSLGFRIKKDSVVNLLSKFGLELEDVDQKLIVDVQAKENVTQDDQEVEVEPTRILQRAITKSDIKGIDDLKNNKELEESKKKLFKVVESQIKEAKLDFEKRALESIKPIETYLNQDGFKKLTKTALKASLGVYNYNYKTNHTIANAPAHLIEYSELFAKITLYGWEGVDLKDFSKEAIKLVNIPKNYKGIDSTTKEQLNNKKENFDQKAFIEDRQQTIWDGLEEGVFHRAQEEMANGDGRIWMGVITCRDDRVRGPHRLLDNKYAKVGGMPNPNYDFGDRCLVYRGQSEEEMIKMGFSKFN